MRTSSPPGPLSFRAAAAALPLASIVLTGSGLAGCNFARMADKMTVRTMAPGILALPDIGLGCATGAALTPIVGALPGSRKAPPNRALVMTYMSAGMCAEPRAWDAELAGAVASQEGRAASATDLFESERRHHASAAARYYLAWNHLEAAFGAVGTGECPDLSTKDNEDLLYLLGLSTGLLALVHDSASGGVVDVPLDVPRFVDRGAECLDDDQWWGVPRALRAAVWATVPGAGPEGVDPLAVLAESATKGDAAGVRLARAFQTQTLAGIGDTDALKSAITAHADAVHGDVRTHDPHGLLNTYATLLVRHESDRIWVAETGHRTPAGQLGLFPAPPMDPSESDGLDDLLDALIPGLGDEPEAASAAPEKDTP